MTLHDFLHSVPSFLFLDLQIVRKDYSLQGETFKSLSHNPDF